MVIFVETHSTLILLPSTIQSLYLTIQAMFSTVTFLNALARQSTDIFALAIWKTFRHNKRKLNVSPKNQLKYFCN